MMLYTMSYKYVSGLPMTGSEGMGTQPIKNEVRRLHVALPSQLDERLEGFVERAGVSRAAAIKSALHDYLDARGF